MDDYELSSYPNSRVATFDVGKIGNKKHHIIGLMEVDVTLARQKIRQHIREKPDLGFTSWMIKIIGTTVGENRYVHAINRSGKKQILFKDVDISFPVEKEIASMKVPLAAVIRKADKKSIEEIHKEIQALKNKKIRSETDYVLEESRSSLANVIFFNLPQIARMLIWKFLLNNAFRIKRNMGTVMVTNIGTAGALSGWIIPKSIHNLSFGLGSINKKPWVVDGKIEIREILHLTLLFDHDVVDGAPAARFAARLIDNMEKARGLERG